MLFSRCEKKQEISESHGASERGCSGVKSWALTETLIGQWPDALGFSRHVDGSGTRLFDLASSLKDHSTSLLCSWHISAGLPNLAQPQTHLGNLLKTQRSAWVLC